MTDIARKQEVIKVTSSMPEFLVHWKITMAGRTKVSASTFEEAVKKVENMDIAESLWDPLSPDNYNLVVVSQNHPELK